MYLVLLETSGNQNYIFSTNKLRENVGASELTYQIGTKAVLEAIDETYTDPQDLQKFLLDETQNEPIEKQNEDGVEVIIATSGKSLLLTKSPDKAKEIVRKVTGNALREMPGLTVHGAIVEVKDDLTDIHDAVKRVHRKLEDIRYQIPSNLQRFPRLPFVEPCATSGLPASEVVKFKNNQGEDVFAFSNVTTSKRKALAKEENKISNKDEFKKGRIIDLLETAFDVELPKNLEEFEEVFPKNKWLSVIHADGNGLGEIFLKFDEYLGIERNQDEKKTFKTKEDARKYLDSYRKFSIALDICTINAAGFAIKSLQSLFMKDEAKFAVPIIPIILGGDDLTVLCDGEYALKFTCDFLARFEKETKMISQEFEMDGVNFEFDYFADILDEIQGIIPKIAKEAFGVDRLGICAGIAIIKPHYPFHQAYDLAENLIKSAKQVKTKIKHQHNGKEVALPCSAMDFHVLYDSSGVELNQIREKLEVSEPDKSKTHLYAKPYIVSDLTEKPEDEIWMNHRKWSELEKRVRAMSAKDDDNKNKLPNSQLHHVRESLFRGKAETDSEIDLFWHRYKDKGFDVLLWKKDKSQSLFFPEKHKKDGVDVDGHATHFLDALDVVELWKGFEYPKNDKNGGAE